MWRLLGLLGRTMPWFAGVARRAAQFEAVKRLEAKARQPQPKGLSWARSKGFMWYNISKIHRTSSSLLHRGR
jgi:hypothetical protein